MVSSFHPHSMCTKVERVTAKTRCTSCTNWTISFEVWGVSDENSSTLKRLKLGTVSSFHPHSICTKVERVTAKTGCTSCTNWTISFEVWGVSDENSSTLKRLKLGMVSSFHPHSMCTKVERVTEKTGCISCTNWTISFEVLGVSDENSSTPKRLKLGRVSSFHPHSMSTKVQSLTAKSTSCTNWTISFEVWGVSDENSSTLKRLKLGMVSSFHPHSMCT